MKSVKFLLLIAVIAVSGCQKDTKVIVSDDGAHVAVSIPADATAAELINMQTALSNSLTVKADRERMAYNIAQAKLRKAEREFYAILVVSGVVGGIVSVFSVGMFVIVKRVGGVK